MVASIRYHRERAFCAGIGVLACLIARSAAAQQAPVETAPIASDAPAAAAPAGDDSATWYRRASERYGASDFAQAAALAEQGLVAFPNDAALLGLLGYARLSTREYAAAARALELASQASPRDPTLKLALGRCYEALGDTPRARAAYDAALALDAAGEGASHANDAQYHVLIGFAARDSQTARRAFERALELDPKNPQALAGLSRSFGTASAPPAQARDRDAPPSSYGAGRARRVDGPSGAIIVNPLSFMVGVINKIYSGGFELLVGGRNVAFSVSPQIGVLGQNNSFDLPDGALGLGLLVGARANLSDYLTGGYVHPRFGPVHWADDEWAFWAMVGEVEAGYTIPLTSSRASIVWLLQLGAGLRIIVPSSGKLRFTGESDGPWGATQVEAELKPTLSPLLNLSVGMGWR